MNRLYVCFSGSPEAIEACYVLLEKLTPFNISHMLEVVDVYENNMDSVTAVPTLVTTAGRHYMGDSIFTFLTRREETKESTTSPAPGMVDHDEIACEREFLQSFRQQNNRVPFDPRQTVQDEHAPKITASNFDPESIRRQRAQLFASVPNDEGVRAPQRRSHPMGL